MTMFLNRRVRILSTASSDLGRQHAGEHATIVHQVGTLEEGVRSYTVRLDNMEMISLQPDEVEILD